MDTFEKKSREASVEPTATSPADEQGYSQARKLSEAAARGLEGEEQEEGEATGGEAEQLSDDDDII